MKKSDLIRKCNCSISDSPGGQSQEKMYGKGYRCHTRGGGKDGKSKVYRCTVCGKETRTG